MKKYSKKYQAALAKVDADKIYSLEEAAKLVKETSVTSFDASVDVSFNLNVNPTLADQLIRGTLSLPHGNGKEKRILVVTNAKQEEAKAAGADFVGGKEILEKIQTQNWFRKNGPCPRSKRLDAKPQERHRYDGCRDRRPRDQER